MLQLSVTWQRAFWWQCGDGPNTERFTGVTIIGTDLDVPDEYAEQIIYTCMGPFSIEIDSIVTWSMLVNVSIIAWRCTVTTVLLCATVADGTVSVRVIGDLGRTRVIGDSLTHRFSWPCRRARIYRNYRLQHPTWLVTIHVSLMFTGDKVTYSLVNTLTKHLWTPTRWYWRFVWRRKHIHDVHVWKLYRCL